MLGSALPPNVKSSILLLRRSVEFLHYYYVIERDTDTQNLKFT